MSWNNTKLKLIFLFRQLLDELLVLTIAKDEKESPKDNEDESFPSSSTQKGVLQDRYKKQFLPRLRKFLCRYSENEEDIRNTCSVFTKNKR